ncbi:nucleoporin-domain-containing protein [Lentithecium fluviatile CBS 122367]|uniref:Nucleoporin-domain-containing protein n=1 Tax=Lentithecium fluviatile CBS 122367 TaxID=1168545 RepID=A0A6G1J2A9_9PLEO|nr:nucleoporin-domain-containing protein [Lentithecium fluviatile CBS 122367]
MALSMPPATPQRPTPGAFINTPARPGLLRSASVQQQAPAPVDTPIQRAARTINAMLERDNRYPALEQYVGQGMSGDYDLPQNPAWAPFQKLKTYKHPEEVFDQVNQMQMSTKMGLFAEINHAYVFVDNQLYLWDYTHPNPELQGFEEQANNITCVKLVKPRAGVFVNNISWLVVVATVADIYCIGVECETGPEGVHRVKLYRTGLSVSVRGLSITAIEGSNSTGRIFFGEGNSEDVWELTYQQGERWFTSRCGKVNHVSRAISLPSLPFYGAPTRTGIRQIVVDDSRKLLYTLSTNSTIKVYHMRTEKTLESVIIRNLSQFKTMCSHVIRQAAVLENMKLVSIDPISSEEAENLSLMATTSTGVRLLLSTTSGGWLSDSTNAPNSMALRHIRMPPMAPDAPPAQQQTSSSTQMQSYQGGTPIGSDSRFLTETVGGFRYAPGSFFCFVERSPNDPNHTLFASAPHAGQLINLQEAPRYCETGQIIQIQGKMQDIGQVTPPFSARNSPVGFANELAVQFDKPASEYAILTHFGVETVRRRRLVDIFAALAKQGGGPDGLDGAKRQFATQYGLIETASTALAVACGQGSDVGADAQATKVTDPDVLELARSAFIAYGGRAYLTESAMVEGLSVDNVKASARHDGIALYVARLVRSIWNTPIMTETKMPAGVVLQSTHKIAKLQEIQRALVRLQEFLDTNRSNIEGLSGAEALGRVTSRKEEVELQGENRALTSLLQMINNIIEGIAFSLVLFEERLEEILLLLPEESRIAVRKLTFHALFAVRQGKELARDLVKAIVNHSIARGSNVETIAEALRRKCGSFCSSDDVVIFKAQENLKKAADVGANAERGRLLLNDSLRLFEQVAKSLSSEHLTAAIDRYIELQFYAGAIRLTLKVAQELDRGNRALSWIKDGRPAQDARQVFYDNRTACYGLVFRVIEAVDLAYNAQGVIPPDGVISQITRRKHEAYEQINNSDDEVFQNYLYDWYLSKGWADRLLEIQSPYVVDYLRRSSDKDPAAADLLWRYYAHYHDYLSAAEVQFQLAKSNFDLSLEKRIEYLSRAKANASTRTTGFSDAGVRNRQSRQELLRNISDNLDVANIQDDVLQQIKSDPRLVSPRREEVIKLLDGKIQELDDLYHSYADQAGYYDICLLIYHSAGYRNIADIRHTWSNVIEQSHRKAVSETQTAPWESVALQVEDIGRRVNLSETIFPVTTVLQLLLQYDVLKYTHDPLSLGSDANKLLCSNLTWPIDIFVKLGAPFEALIATLEAMWYAQEDPFNNRTHRKLLVKWMIYTVEQWYDVSKRQGQAFGGAENAIGLADCLRVVLGSGDLQGSGDDAVWAEKGRLVRGKVEEAAR